MGLASLARGERLASLAWGVGLALFLAAGVGLAGATGGGEEVAALRARILGETPVTPQVAVDLDLDGAMDRFIAITGGDRPARDGLADALLEAIVAGDVHDWLALVPFLTRIHANKQLTKLLLRVEDPQCCFYVALEEALLDVGGPAEAEALAAGLPAAYRADYAGLIDTQQGRKEVER